MEHGWITSASDNQLDSATKALKKYNASRKLRKAALGIIAQQKMTRALESLRVSQGVAPKAADPTAS